MKRRVFPLLMAGVLSVSLAVPALAAEGGSLKTYPVLTQDETEYVPLRAIAEDMGFTVTWDQPSQTATVSNDARSVQLRPLEQTINVSGTEGVIETPMLLEEDRIYVNTSFFPDYLDIMVALDGYAPIAFAFPSLPQETEPTITTYSTYSIYCYSSAAAEMLGKSKFVGVVNVLELDKEGTTFNGNLYRCSVDSLIAGENLTTYDDNTFLLWVLKDTVEVGSSYVIGFSSSSERSVYYTQATATSVYEVSEELLSELAQLQASAQDLPEDSASDTADDVHTLVEACLG